MAYATYQLAEMTIWPLLTRRTFELADIDRFLSTARGSIPSVPQTLFHARGAGHVATVLVVTFVSVLLKVDTFLVGLAFKTALVPTILYSSQSLDGGIGMSFKQRNPPSTLPGAVAAAFVSYSAWANNQTDEPMVPQRFYVANRNKLNAIGNFSAHAIEIVHSTNCSGLPIDMSGDVTNVDGDRQWKVETANSNLGDVWLRLQPELTVWVDDTLQTGSTAARTTLIFGAINGSIEGGYVNVAPEDSAMMKAHYLSVSTLTCDVNVQLIDSSFCTYPEPDHPRCQSPPDTTLTTIAGLHHPGDSVWEVAMWLGAVTSNLGISVAGAQPLFSPGPNIEVNGTKLALPIAWTSTVDTNNPGGPGAHWTQANLTAFLETGAGALASAMTTAFTSSKNVTRLESAKPLLRMETWRTFILLFPVVMTILSFSIMVYLTEKLYRSCNVHTVHLGTSAEIIDSSQNSDMKAVVENARKSPDAHRVLSKIKVRYGELSEGGIGIGQKTNVTALRRSDWH